MKNEKHFLPTPPLFSGSAPFQILYLLPSAGARWTGNRGWVQSFHPSPLVSVTPSFSGGKFLRVFPFCNVESLPWKTPWTPPVSVDPFHGLQSSQARTALAWPFLRATAFFGHSPLLLHRVLLRLQAGFCSTVDLQRFSLPSPHGLNGNCYSGMPPHLLSHWPGCLHGCLSSVSLLSKTKRAPKTRELAQQFSS